MLRVKLTASIVGNTIIADNDGKTKIEAYETGV